MTTEYGVLVAIDTGGRRFWWPVTQQTFESYAQAENYVSEHMDVAWIPMYTICQREVTSWEVAVEGEFDTLEGEERYSE